MAINFSYSSEYENMLKFINELQESELNFIISNLNFLITEDNLVSVTMSASIYAIDFIELEEYEKLIWKDIVEFGKNNPFVNNSVPTANASNNTEKSAVKFDFVMTLKPTSSDLPTIVFGKTKLEDKNSYVFDDENAIKDIIINLKSEDGKYYFQYSTVRHSYPATGEWLEFIPENSKNIAMKIYSSPRNSSNDASGANIKIDNKTDLLVNVYIENDDEKKPRAIFESKKGLSIK
jgi:type IV pilus assembly protein PilO